MRCSKETEGCIHGARVTAGFRAGEVSSQLLDERDRKSPRAAPVPTQIECLGGAVTWGLQSPGSMQGYREKAIFLPCLPGSICVKEEVGKAQGAIFALEQWQRGCSAFTLL